MKENIKKWLKPILFTAGGALVGLAYYYFVGCSTGACPLTSNPFITMAIWLYRLAVVRCVRKGVQRFIAICSSLPGGNHHLHIALTASYAAPSIPPILQAVGNTPQKDFVGRIGIC